MCGRSTSNFLSEGSYSIPLLTSCWCECQYLKEGLDFSREWVHETLLEAT